MEQTVQVTLKQQDDGRYLARSQHPALWVVADTPEEALEFLQEELLFALESSYAGTFKGNFSSETVMVRLEVEQ
jgi:predicted RNase H-like HicB family nuclease